MELKDAGLPELLAELHARTKNCHIEQRRATRTKPDGGVEVFPCWFTSITFMNEDPERETVVGHAGRLADWEKGDAESDSDIDVSDHELRHGPPDV